jgi:hypothetical protein
MRGVVSDVVCVIGDTGSHAFCATELFSEVGGTNGLVTRGLSFANKRVGLRGEDLYGIEEVLDCNGSEMIGG